MFSFHHKKYCKLLEHLVWFVVSRIRLCILTEFCFKLYVKSSLNTTRLLFIFNLFRKCFQSYVRLYYEIILKRWDENDAAMEFTALLFCIFGRRKIFCRNGKLQSMSKQYMMCSGKCTSRYVCCVSQMIANVGVMNFGVDIVQLCKPIWIENNKKVVLTYFVWQHICCLIDILFHDLWQVLGIQRYNVYMVNQKFWRMKHFVLFLYSLN